jgi:hypothetical protein
MPQLDFTKVGVGGVWVWVGGCGWVGWVGWVGVASLEGV